MRNTLRTSRAMPISLLNLGGKQLKKNKNEDSKVFLVVKIVTWKLYFGKQSHNSQ